MPILLVLIIGAYLLIKCGAEDASLRKRANNYMDPRIANGAHLPTDRDKEDAYFYMLEENYKYGDKSMYPPEKLDFFAHHPSAWYIWAKSEAEEKMIADGYAPRSQWLSYDRTVYNDHYFYRTSSIAREEQEYYRQKAMRDKYAISPQ
jgi:hypothetical protein